MKVLSRSSLTRKVPLVLSTLILVVVLSQAAVGYLGFKRVLTEHEGERLEGVAELLGRLVTQSMGQRITEGDRLAADPTLLALLTMDAGTDARDSAARRLELALQDEAQGLAMTVRDAAGTCVLSVWRPDPEEPAVRVDGCPDGAAEAEAFAEPGTGPSRIVEWPAGEYSYALSSAIVGADSARLGVLTRRVRITSSVGTQLLASLIAPDARLVFGNADGGAGTEGFEALPPEATADPDALHTFATGEGPRIGVGARIDATPWAVWVHRDSDIVLQPARSILTIKLWSGLVLLLLFSVLGWLLSTRVTGPLLNLTQAAEAVSRGDLQQRVPVRSEDELGRLGHAFNTMAEAVKVAHDELEERVDERTRELAATVDQLKEAQEELVRKERLAILGQLSGGVGHELRNPLGVMTNAIYFLRAVLGDAPAKVREYLDIIATQIDLSQKIVGDLLDYARVKPPRRAALSAEELLTKAVERSHPPGNVEIVREIEDGLDPLWVDGDQIGQVLLNLVMNAVQALDDSGRGRVTLSATGENGRVRLAVSDNGPGVPKELAEKIFQPLFTTKARGIGLGLAISRSLVQANDGELVLERPPGGGTRFSVLLPAAGAGAKRTEVTNA